MSVVICLLSVVSFCHEVEREVQFIEINSPYSPLATNLINVIVCEASVSLIVYRKCGVVDGVGYIEQWLYDRHSQTYINTILLI